MDSISSAIEANRVAASRSAVDAARATGARDGVAVFHAFLGRCHEILDAPGLSPEEKRGRFLEFERELTDPRQLDRSVEDAEWLAMLQQVPAAHEHARHVLQAFQKEAGNPVFRSWSELLAFAQYAAAPAGRLLFQTRDEPRDVWPIADAVFIAQWLGDTAESASADFRERGRVYLPQQWFRDFEAASADLGADPPPARLFPLYRRSSDAIDALLNDGRRGLRRIADAALRREMCALIARTRRRAARLRRRGPRVQPSPLSAWESLRARMEGYWLWRRSM